MQKDCTEDRFRPKRRVPTRQQRYIKIAIIFATIEATTDEFLVFILPEQYGEITESEHLAVSTVGENVQAMRPRGLLEAAVAWVGRHWNKGDLLAAREGRSDERGAQVESPPKAPVRRNLRVVQRWNCRLFRRIRKIRIQVRESGARA